MEEGKLNMFIALVMLFIVLAVAAAVLEAMSNSMQTATETITYTNESIDPALNGTTGTALNCVSHPYFTSLTTSSVVVFNGTVEQVISATNYTIDTGGYFNLTTEGALEFNGTRIQINYTTDNVERDHVYNITDDSELGNAEIAGFAAVMGILVAVMLLLGFLFMIKGTD